MAWTLFDNFRLNQLNGAAVTDFDTDTIKVAICTNTFTPNQATHDFFNDVTNEVSGTNYTAGGPALANKSVALASGTVKFDADDVVIAQSGAGFSNGRHLILYKDTGTASTSPLIAFHTAGADFGNVAGALTIQMDAAGIITSP